MQDEEKQKEKCIQNQFRKLEKGKVKTLVHLERERERERERETLFKYFQTIRLRFIFKIEFARHLFFLSGF